MRIELDIYFGIVRIVKIKAEENKIYCFVSKFKFTGIMLMKIMLMKVFITKIWKYNGIMNSFWIEPIIYKLAETKCRVWLYKAKCCSQFLDERIKYFSWTMTHYLATMWVQYILIDLLYDYTLTQIGYILKNINYLFNTIML